MNDNLTIWGNTSQSWGNRLHSLCSYLGTFPPSLPHSLIELFTKEGDVVLDPFSGRGTVLLESRLLGRHSLSSDLNPIAYALTSAKNQSVSIDEIIERVNELRARYDELIYLNEAAVQSEDIKLIFDKRTLAELCYLRRKIVDSDNPIDRFLAGLTLGILHGNEKKDGTSSYASISMPNTFSMSPTYVRKYVSTKNLNRVYRNVFDLITNKAELINKFNSFPQGNEGIVVKSDARSLAKNPKLKEFHNKVDLIITSPPYLNIVNYAKQNWIRSWFMNSKMEDLSDDLDDNLTLDNWMNFMKDSLREMKKFIKDEGTIILVIGDVVKSSRTSISLARELLRHLYHTNDFKYIGLINDRIKSAEKTTKIWKDTKGKATETDRVVILSNTEPEVRFEELEKEFEITDSQKANFNPDYLVENAKKLAGV